MQNSEMLLDYNYIVIDQKHIDTDQTSKHNKNVALGTVLANFAFYGYTLSKESIQILSDYNSKQIANFWIDVKPSLESITGNNRNMGDYVVYKNFPKEVLSKTDAEYWISQILMYIGLPNELFTEDEKTRKPLNEKIKLKVLHLAPENVYQDIYSSLLVMPNKWNDKQYAYAKFLMNTLNIEYINVEDIKFKTNAITLAKEAIANNKTINIQNAIDVLRLGAALSNGDISLRQTVKFKKFNRKERKELLSLLDNSPSLEQDITRKTEVWKKFLRNLHPGDYSFKNVQNAYNKIYNKQAKSISAQVELCIKNKDNSILNVLENLPGEFLRRFHKLYEVFNTETVSSIVKVLDKLDTLQLLKFEKYLNTINNKTHHIYTPNGNWTKAQFIERSKTEIKQDDLIVLNDSIHFIINYRLTKLIPNGVNLSKKTNNIKLQTNDQELASYGCGTEFKIPKKMNYLRTASYWQKGSSHNIWFDNGWNFFDKDWKAIDTCCWNSTKALKHGKKVGAVFSGDPTNSKDLDGKACQMIDVYIQQAINSGAKYAVWNILSYSGIPFNEADDVLATLQYGENPEEGNLFEPSRAQMVFPIKGNNLTKYVAYIDLLEKKLIYMDANFYGTTQTAKNNEEKLSKSMPYFVEYVKTLPTVYDLFKHANKGNTFILHSDKKVKLKDNDLAYVFKPENKSNQFTQLDLQSILSDKTLVSHHPTKRNKIS